MQHVVIIGATSWMYLARIVRAEFLSLKEREFILAARATGGLGEVERTTGLTAQRLHLLARENLRTAAYLDQRFGTAASAPYARSRGYRRVMSSSVGTVPGTDTMSGIVFMPSNTDVDHS